MDGIFFELTIVLGLATVAAFVMQMIKLPPILGYLAAGLLIVPLGDLFGFSIEEVESFDSLSKIGITLLLFMLGLEMKLGELQSVGKVSLITGIGQIVFTSFIGLLLAIGIGYGFLGSVYMAIALTFSSTIVIVKLLSDKNDINSLYGKISIGFLLVQDFVAIMALVLLNGISSAGADASAFDQFLNIVIITIKSVIIFGVIVALSQNIIPKMVTKIAKSQEMLFIFSITWAFGIAALISSDLIGLSIEIGGFLAGLALANSTESYQIVSKVKALRDFFIVLFFVTLGIHLDLSNFGDALLPGIYLSAFVLIGNPLIVLLILTQMGYRSRTSFLAGLSVAQISEFSLIVLFLGKEIGHVDDEIISVATIVAIITFAVSSYMILNGEKLYSIMDSFLSKFEKTQASETIQYGDTDLIDHTILVGTHRMGTAILKNLEEEKDSLLVIDFDPDRIEELKNQDYNVLFGDVIDSDIQELAGFAKASTIISTIPNLEDNIILIHAVRKVNGDARIIVSAERDEFVKELYRAGASMVIQPYATTGNLLSSLLKHRDLEFE